MLEQYFRLSSLITYSWVPCSYTAARSRSWAWGRGCCRSRSRRAGRCWTGRCCGRWWRDSRTWRWTCHVVLDIVPFAVRVVDMILKQTIRIGKLLWFYHINCTWVWSRLPNTPAAVPTRESVPTLSVDKSQNIAPARPFVSMYWAFNLTMSGVSYETNSFLVLS